MKRGSKKHGVDWMRYTKEVLKPILIPWIYGLEEEASTQILFLQDNATPHMCKWSLEVL